ncbi:copper chaperone PCu(A)C [Brachybacterium saurashtrense]|uniref:Copper chaperone PCu(A)C n=1 Tax=Brachybacterium saurashtrense TaxID=556288 RepID=A0A345YRE3_9MICO|nr:copper chaperone PCu(A)C [Brachybacterium saurashtrense]AXK46495.1 copper chaperone PCu(A)C [Brachybacterium saurashtrense]RRR24236.1 copper chaperone PCu(A)C [Brachybacterium saurashtrense]
MSDRFTLPAPISPRSARIPRRAALAALLLPLAACTTGGDETASGTAGAGASDGGGTGAEELTLVDPWVKAAEEGMTAAFGTLVNRTGRDLQLIGASSPSAGMVELHETASDGSGGMSMQEKEGGFPVPDGGELLLEPGGNHLMLMDLAAPLQPGDKVELTLTCEDGTALTVAATVKDFAGAQEHYEPEGSSGSGASDAGGEDHAAHGGHGTDGDADASAGAGVEDGAE